MPRPPRPPPPPGAGTGAPDALPLALATEVGLSRTTGEEHALPSMKEGQAE